MITKLHPKRVIEAMDQIDSEKPSHTLDRRTALRRVFSVLATVCVCLLIIHYMKYFSSFRSGLTMLSEAQGLSSQYWYQKLSNAGLLQLASYSWWTFWHIVGYVLIPFIIIKYHLKTSFTDMGWRWADTGKHWSGYVLLISPILLFIFLVSFRGDFLNHYPFYKQAQRSWFDFVTWEMLYLTQFLCLEFFFRGFMLNALRPAIGANAIWVMCVPYLMIHFPKLWLEATGAILFGLFLGILALRSRSIWGGFLVHAGIAVTMDVASLMQQNKLPDAFWPF